MSRLPKTIALALGVALGLSAPTWAADGKSPSEASDPPSATGAEDRSADRRAAHEARVQALREETERFRDWADSTRPAMDPWATRMQAWAELQRRMMDPYGAAMIDRLEADFRARTAAYGDIPGDPSREAAESWAKGQQQAIYDWQRRAWDQWAKAGPRVVYPYVPYAPVWGYPWY